MELPHTVALLLLSLFLFHHHEASAEKRSVYIVHMDKSSMPKAFSSHHYWYSSILKSAKSVTQTSLNAEDKSEPELIYTYDNAMHGFSALISDDELEAIRTSPGFLSAYTDDVGVPETTHSYEFLGLNIATGLWPASQYGKDIIIGVLDSGIWPESPSFSDNGMAAIPASWKGICQAGEQFNSSMCNRKIIGARHFNSGYKAQNPNAPVTPDSARDVDGHGTHVASTAAGNYVNGVSFSSYAPGTARGMAPRAMIAVYKVLWSNSVVSSDLLAAVDQAVADGVHIISLSLSFPSNILYRNPISIASFGARDKGILVSASAGNQGPGARTVRSGVPWVLIVAAGTVDRWFAGNLTLGNGNVITGWSLYRGSVAVRNVRLVYNRTLSACDSTQLLAQAPAQTVIVCDLTIRNIAFTTVMQYLGQSRVRAAIIISGQTNIFRSTAFPFPGVVISTGEAQSVISYASSTASPTASIDFRQTILGRQPRAAPALSETSSRGPSPMYDGILKPDILAPGVLILAAYSRGSVSTYSLLSGTSMACPHISGIAALLKAAHPTWSPAAIQSAMMTTANPLNNVNQPIREQDNSVATTLGYGSGLVDPNRALDPGLVYDASIQDLVNLVCSTNLTRQQIQAIIGSNYACSSPNSDLNYPSFTALIPLSQSGQTITRTFQRTLTNVGPSVIRYRVQIEAPQNTTVTIQPEALMFRATNERLSYSLTITYRGDIQTPLRSGSITWIDTSGRYRVRSPIVVYPQT